MVERIAKASKVPFINAQRFEKEKDGRLQGKPDHIVGSACMLFLKASVSIGF